MKKAQMKMMENMMVLMIFMLLLVVGIVFYAKFTNISMQEKAKEFSRKELIELGQKVPYVTEVQCPTYLEYENCLDKVKLEVFKNFSEENIALKSYYQQIMGFSNLTVQEVYPGNDSVNFYSMPKDNWQSSRSIMIPISVYDPTKRKRSFAILKVRKFS